MIYCSNVAQDTYKTILKARIKQNIAVSKIEQEILKHPEAIVIATYRSTLPQFALAFGLAPPLAPNLGPSLIPLFNNFYMWDGGIKKLLKYGEPMISLDVLQEQIDSGKTVLLSTPILYPDLNVFSLDPLVLDSAQQLYKVKNTVSKLKNKELIP